MAGNLETPYSKVMSSVIESGTIQIVKGIYGWPAEATVVNPFNTP